MCTCCLNQTCACVQFASKSCIRLHSKPQAAHICGHCRHSSAAALALAFTLIGRGWRRQLRRRGRAHTGTPAATVAGASCVPAHGTVLTAAEARQHLCLRLCQLLCVLCCPHCLQDIFEAASSTWLDKLGAACFLAYPEHRVLAGGVAAAAVLQALVWQEPLVCRGSRVRGGILSGGQVPEPRAGTAAAAGQVRFLCCLLALCCNCITRFLCVPADPWRFAADALCFCASAQRVHGSCLLGQLHADVVCRPAQHAAADSPKQQARQKSAAQQNGTGPSKQPNGQRRKPASSKKTAKAATISLLSSDSDGEL